MISGDHRDGPERTGAPPAVATKRSAVKKGLPLPRDGAGARSPNQIATPRRCFRTLTDARTCAFLPVLPHPQTDREMRARPLAETEATRRPFGRAEGWLGETDRSALGRREHGGVRLGVEGGGADRNLGTRSRACAGFAQTQRPVAVSHRPLSRYLGSRSGPAPA